MTAAELRTWCVGRPGAVEEFPFGERVSVFKVGGKMFHDAVGPGYHLNKRHWNTVVIDGTLADEVLAQMLEDSYDLVVDGLTRTQREALPGLRGGGAAADGL